MRKKGTKNLTNKFDTDFRFVVKHNPALAPWADLLRDYWAAELPGKTSKSAQLHSNSLKRFAICYLDGQGLSHLSPEDFFAANKALPPLADGLSLETVLNESRRIEHSDVVIDFLEWVLRATLSKEDAEGHCVVPTHLAMPFQRIRNKIHGKESDLSFLYVLKLDPKLEDWRALAAEWFKAQTVGVAQRRQAIDLFLVAYLHGQNLDRNFGRFLLRETPKPSFAEVLLAAKTKGSSHLSNDNIKANNYASDFIDWLLASRLGDEEGEWDRSRFHNPVPRMAKTGIAVLTESNKAVLSIRYIKECRELLAEGPSFRDWQWAQGFCDSSTRGGDWFVVEPERVDRSDPDCVWRERKTSSDERSEKGYPPIVTELWSPVRAVALYLKLELPLRLIQVRMLDSGEADTYRYEHDAADGGHFVSNPGPLTTGDARRPFQRGVFHRSNHDKEAGLFINTNKTADINKPENAKGYVIPWAHPKVLYWLTKLRDWQVNYNPLQAPALWTDLTNSHFGRTPPHPSVLAQRGTACFLFRDPCAKRPDLPIFANAFDLIWRRLLSRLESRCAARGETLDDGEPLNFVVPDSRVTYFPLQALRVSLISYLVLDLQLPLPIVSKLIAGHATIIMTLYYTKLGHTKMAEVLEEAERRTLEADQSSHRRFLKDATYEQIKTRFASLSDDAPLAAVGVPGTGLVFEDRGICPVGGAKCDVGGEEIGKRKDERVFTPVPGYPRERNCVRCRFFLTGPAFLPGLTANFNAVSERAHRASTHWQDLEQRERDLELERYQCEQLGNPFLKTIEIERVSQRTQEAEEACSRLLNDMQATYHLIQRSIETQKSSDDSEGIKLVASGTMQDLSAGFIEATSELHQLEVVCQNAEIYTNPEATPAVLRRAQLLDRMLRFNRIPPVLMYMDEKMQLQVGNALMQLIKARTGSIQGSLPYAECQKKLTDLGIHPRDLEAEMTRVMDGPQVMQIIQQAKALNAGPDTDKEQE